VRTRKKAKGRKGERGQGGTDGETGTGQLRDRIKISTAEMKGIGKIGRGRKGIGMTGIEKTNIGKIDTRRRGIGTIRETTIGEDLPREEEGLLPTKNTEKEETILLQSSRKLQRRGEP